MRKLASFVAAACLVLSSAPPGAAQRAPIETRAPSTSGAIPVVFQPAAASLSLSLWGSGLEATTSLPLDAGGLAAAPAAPLGALSLSPAFPPSLTSSLASAPAAPLGAPVAALRSQAPAPHAGPSLDALPALGSLERAVAPSGGSSGVASRSPESGLAAPSEFFDEAAVRGKTLLLVGTRASREFILNETVRVSKKLGLNLVLLDRPEDRAHSAPHVPEANFIPAPIDDRTAPTIASNAARVVDFARNSAVDAVISFRSHHAKLTGEIVDRLRARGVAKRAVVTADTKPLMREAVNAKVPEQSVPFRRITSVEEARRAYAELGGGKFILKTVQGENSRFLATGLDSAEAVAAAYRRMDKAVSAFAKQHRETSSIFNRHPGIFMERELEPVPGTNEVSVEVVMQRGKAAIAVVSDTLKIGKKDELAGASMTFPSQLGRDMQKAFVAAAEKALNAVGILEGNARIDMMMTKDGARVIEINPYLGGSAVHTAVLLQTGVSLIEQGIRAILGLKVEPIGEPLVVVDYRFAASAADGTLEAVGGFDDARGSPGVQHLQMLNEIGDSVTAPVDNGYEENSEIMAVGKDFPEARGRNVKALGKLRLYIRKADGTLLEQKADYLQPGGSDSTKAVSGIPGR
ncbi:MAG: ATP-grasp domain-containing protein [Elusimicrobia bacterium]|nr:ATP-grasp domain-containing protein [Elusimicrobiota bacterium]